MNYQTLVIQRIHTTLESYLDQSTANAFYEKVKYAENAPLRPFSKTINSTLSDMLSAYESANPTEVRKGRWALSTPANGDAVAYWLDDIQNIAIPILASLRKVNNENQTRDSQEARG